MAQKFLSIKNFEKYQHYKHRNPPWIRLYGSLFGDREFLQMPIRARYLYVGLLTLAAQHGNAVRNDCNWIAHRLGMDVSEVDLKPLYRSGFLLASRKHIASIVQAKQFSDSSDSSDNSEDTEGQSIGRAASASPSRVVPLRGSVYPDGFEFDPRADALAKSYGLNPHKEQAAFRDHHVAKGTIFKDWQAAFRNWLRNSVKFAARGVK